MQSIFLLNRYSISGSRCVLKEDRVERRLAAVLAADIAGYSGLMGADEEGTLSRLKALRKTLLDPKIAEHRGRIVKTTGDGILIEFASASLSLIRSGRNGGVGRRGLAAEECCRRSGSLGVGARPWPATGVFGCPYRT